MALAEAQHHAASTETEASRKISQLEDPQGLVPRQVPHHLNLILSRRGDPAPCIPPKNQRTVLVVGGFCLRHGEGCDLRTS